MTGRSKPTLLVAHFHFWQPHKAKQKNEKELPSQRTKTAISMSRHNDNGQRSTTGNRGLAIFFVRGRSAFFNISAIMSGSAFNELLCYKSPHKKHRQAPNRQAVKKNLFSSQSSIFTKRYPCFKPI